ncbi:MAG: hypothetical protein HC880_07130 [Bacteroidia bacterium]|nr:hypothetical protein [Bacteroidia bacterium]
MATKYINAKTGEVYEYGISSQPLNKDGSSPRVKQKIRDKYANNPDAKGDVVKRNLRGRTRAKSWETGRSTSYANRTKKFEGPPGNVLPKPDVNRRVIPRRGYKK